MYNEVIENMLQFNKAFVQNKSYDAYAADKYPDKKIAIVACMDTRLTHLLPAALGLKNGDVKMIKNAGAQLISPYDSVMKSIMVGVYELGVTDVMVIGHDACGVQGLKSEDMLELMKKRGITDEAIEKVSAECNLNEWLNGFEEINASVLSAVDMIKEFPLLPADLNVYGFVMDPVTGAIRAAE